MIGAVKRWREKRKERSEVVSIVALQSFPKLLTAETIQIALTNLGIQASLKEEKTSYFRTTIDGYELTIASLPTPYPAFVGKKTMESRISDACTKHTAFMMVDAWKAPEGKNRTEARPLIAKIVSALSDEYVLAFYDWTTRKFCLPDEDIKELLAKGDIDEALNQVGDIVLNVESDDQRIESAIAEAQERWPEFVEAFAQRDADSSFIAKARFEHNDRGEHLWMEVIQCDLNSVTGKVANKPYNIPRPREGDVVTVHRKDISDWLMRGPDGPVGGFVEKILTQG